MPDLDAATLTAVCFGLAVACLVLLFACLGLRARNKALALQADERTMALVEIDRLQGVLARLQAAASVNAFLADSARHFAQQVLAAEPPKPEAE
jgi:hypothetical protein